MQAGRGGRGDNFPPLSFYLFPSLHSRSLEVCRKIQLGVWGTLLVPPAGSRAEPQPTNDLVYFSLKYDFWWQQFY